MSNDTQLVIMNQVSEEFPRAVPGVLTEDNFSPVDLPLARNQWWDFGDAIRSHCGAEILPLFINQGFGDGRYIEDALRLVPVTNDELLMVEMPFGHNGRKPERMAAVAAVRSVLDARGICLQHVICTPNHLLGDGGDTYFSAELRKFFVGISSRSTAEFADYLEGELKNYDIELVRVAINGSCCLHLITGSSLLDDHTVAVHRPSITREGIAALIAAGLKVVEISEHELNGANFFAANGKLIGDGFNCPESFGLVSERYDTRSVRYCQSALKNGSFTCDTVRVPSLCTC